MKKDDVNALCMSVKRSHWNPIIGVKMFAKHHPEVEITPEVYAIAIGVGRTPWPNIQGLPEGPFPVYKNRPFWDERLWNTPQQRAWEAETNEL